MVLIDLSPAHRPHLVRVGDGQSALYQDYAHYSPTTPIMKCLRNRGGLIGLPMHNPADFDDLLSVNSGKPFDAMAALNSGELLHGIH